jgi:hypothetical protein
MMIQIIVNNAQFNVFIVKDLHNNAYNALVNIEILIHLAGTIYNIEIYIVVWMDIMMFLYLNAYNVLINV